MYQFIKELMLSKQPKLEIKEIHLAEDKNLRRKLELEEADVRPNFAKELLEKGYVEFPVYRDNRMLPLGYGAKYCDYEVKYYGGGLCEITQYYGKLELNPQDNRYTKPCSDNPKPKTYWFYYHHEDKRYKHENNMERWNSLIEENHKLLGSNEVNEFIWRFYDFYEQFWKKHVTFLKERGLNDEPTHLDYMEYLYYIDCKRMEAVEPYIQLLYIFGDITEDEYKIAMDSLAVLKQHCEKTQLYLQSRDLEEPYDLRDDHLHGRNIERLEQLLRVAFKPGYFIDPLQERLYPNIGLIYEKIQPAKEFASIDSIRQEYKSLIESAKKAFKIKGRTQINAIRDYIFGFVE